MLCEMDYGSLDQCWFWREFKKLRSCPLFKILARTSIIIELYIHNFLRVKSEKNFICETS